MNLVCGDGAPGKGDLKRSFNTQGVQGDEHKHLHRAGKLGKNCPRAEPTCTVIWEGKVLLLLWVINEKAG